MKRIIRTFLSKKSNVAALLILAAIFGGLATYVFRGISQNVMEMTEHHEEVLYFPDYPPVNTEGKDPMLIKRGEYLAKAGDCIACHTNTPQKGQVFAGGLPMQTPFGTIYSPNITPDKETGIGNWSESDFIKAMRQGISPNGHYYYPAFPYLYFARVSTDDLRAIKAYFDSIPAVHQENRKNEMVWPFSERFLQLPWRLLFFDPNDTEVSQAVFSDNTHTMDQLKRGAYLVEGLGHCAMCHSPSYHIFSEKLSLGAPIRQYDLTGAKIQGYLAPDISKENLANVPIDEITDVFTKDKLIGGGKIEGPMLEVNHDSLRYLAPSDLVAIATYLKSVQSARPPKPTGGSAGKAVYETYCSGCHASGAGGAPKYGDAIGWDPFLKKGIDQVYVNALKGIGSMPAKGTCLSCSDDDIKQAVNYMLDSVKAGVGHAIKLTPIKKLTAADGKRLYEQNCSVCHNTGFQHAPKPGDIQAWQPIVNAGFMNAYLAVVSGQGGHPPRGACAKCTDGELIAAIKYMLQESTTQKDFSLW